MLPSAVYSYTTGRVDILSPMHILEQDFKYPVSGIAQRDTKSYISTGTTIIVTIYRKILCVLEREEV
jgi:hypothetical protein